MSTEREALLLVGNFLDNIYEVHKNKANEKGETFPYDDIIDFREDWCSDMYHADCGFIGFKVLDDYKTIDFQDLDLAQPDFDSERKLREARDKFEKELGVIAKIKPVIWSY